MSDTKTVQLQLLIRGQREWPGILLPLLLNLLSVNLCRLLLLLLLLLVMLMLLLQLKHMQLLLCPPVGSPRRAGSSTSSSIRGIFPAESRGRRTVAVPRALPHPDRPVSHSCH